MVVCEGVSVWVAPVRGRSFEGSTLKLRGSCARGLLQLGVSCTLRGKFCTATY